ncbi:unnamed protein product [Cylindrotheca closterium]|uniref:Uncharacterized protein n=1 Tax=Cylindrotheca closterium TaxID=2856 RepID=A0AAD2CJW0_9STRA|nr:unnamed protein product [Cylindrotheca closterium]
MQEASESTTTGTSQGPSPFTSALDRLEQPTGFENVFHQGRGSFQQGRESAMKGLEQGKSQLNMFGTNLKTNINHFVEKSQDQQIRNRGQWHNFGQQLKTNVNQLVEQVPKALGPRLGEQHTANGRVSLRNFGQQLKTNIGQLVDQQQQPQPDLSNQLNTLNARMKEEAERRDVRKVSEEACRNEMKSHLEEFLQKMPNATYEQWIEDLHPENLSDPQLLKEMDKEVDLRFYVKESDHLILWNQKVQDPVRQIAPRNRVWKDDSKTQLNQPASEPVDLLGGGMRPAAKEPTPTFAIIPNNNTTVPTQGGDIDLMSF